jgi:hypothetical protein
MLARLRESGGALSWPPSFRGPAPGAPIAGSRATFASACLGNYNALPLPREGDWVSASIPQASDQDRGTATRLNPSRLLRPKGMCCQQLVADGGVIGIGVCEGTQLVEQGVAAGKIIFRLGVV